MRSQDIVPGKPYVVNSRRALILEVRVEYDGRQGGVGVRYLDPPWQGYEEFVSADEISGEWLPGSLLAAQMAEQLEEASEQSQRNLAEQRLHRKSAELCAALERLCNDPLQWHGVNPPVVHSLEANPQAPGSVSMDMPEAMVDRLLELFNARHAANEASREVRSMLGWTQEQE